MRVPTGRRWIAVIVVVIVAVGATLAITLFRPGRGDNPVATRPHAAPSRSFVPPTLGLRNTVDVDVIAVAISPDSQTFVTGDVDHSIKRWSVATGEAVGAPLTGHTGIVRAVAYSPDGRMIASASDDGTCVGGTPRPALRLARPSASVKMSTR
jgi:WD40 repeat protein